MQLFQDVPFTGDAYNPFPSPKTPQKVALFPYAANLKS